MCRLGRARFSTGEAGAVAVLLGSGGTASDVFPLAAVALEGISVVRRPRLSSIGDDEGPPFWWPTELGPGGKFALTDRLPTTSLGRDANICAAASKLCCGTRGFAIVDEARGRVGDGGPEDFVPFALEVGLMERACAGASVRTDLAGRWGCERSG